MQKSSSRARRLRLCLGAAAAVLVLCLAHAAVSAGAAAAGDERSLFRTASEVVDVADLELLKLHPAAGLCPWILVAYSDGCGHCRSAAPSVIRRAEETFTAASDVAHSITIAALNCQVNTQGCTELGVRGVPSFFFLAPATLTATEATLQPIALHATNAAAQIDVNKEKANEGLAVAQTLHRFDIGRGGGLDAHLDHARRLWAAMSSEGFSAEAKERCLDMRSYLRNAKQAEILARAAANGAQTGAADGAVAFQEDTDFHTTDVANAFFFTLYHEVALVGLSTPERRYALYRFVRAVQQRLPGLGADVLLHEMAGRNNSNGNAFQPEDFASFTVEDWQWLVMRAGIPFQGTPRDLRWQTCRGSSWRYRGFPCGLWLLYHALTVNTPEGGTAAAIDGLGSAAKTSSEAAAAAAAAAAGQGNGEILFIIKDYARNFFSCETCRQHFMHFKPNHEEDPVWQLWKVHNLVNYHLANVTEGADPLVPKRQFPGKELCPLCYRDVDGGTANPESGVVTAQLMQFLRQRYRWVPSTLRNSTQTSLTKPAGAASGAGAVQQDGPGTIVVHKTPLSVNIFLSMIIVVVLMGLGMRYVLRRAKAAKAKRQRTVLPLRMHS